MLEKITTFLKEVKMEIKKVNWPTRRETVRYTLIVIVVSFVVAAFLGSLDVAFTKFLKIFINTFGNIFN